MLFQNLSIWTIGWMIVGLAVFLRIFLAILDARRRSWRFRSRRSWYRPSQKSRWYPRRRQPAYSVAPQLLLESPIEALFLSTWQQRHNNLVLLPQYEVGPYRLDFAHEPSKVAVELDGFIGHSSTEDIARDRRRQRELEARGWRFIRFGGKEINADPVRCVCEVEAFIHQVKPRR